MNFGDVLIIVGIGWCVVAVTLFGYFMLRQFVYGDDNESDLGLCIRHYQRYCDRVDIEHLLNNMNNSLMMQCYQNDSIDRIPECFGDAPEHKHGRH